MIISIIISLIVYLLTYIFLVNVDLSKINGMFALKIIALSLIAWVPVWLFSIIKDHVDPSDHEIIMRMARRRSSAAGGIATSNDGKLHLNID